MKLLSDILYRTGITQVEGSTHLAIEGIAADSRKCQPLFLFVAVKGVTSDGHAFIDQAIAHGAAAVLCETLPAQLKSGVTYVVVESAQRSLGIAASNFYDHPSSKLKLTGITGTNGKTTCATLLYNLFRLLGYKVGLISTVENRIGDRVIPSTHTTPDAVSLQRMLAEMVEQGCSHCFMEVSSHAVHQDRIAGTEFALAAFTNLTHDHLDYHKTFDNYRDAKKKFFDLLPRNAHALLNKDDRNADFMAQNCKAPVSFFALKREAAFKGRIIEMLPGATLMNINGTELWTKLVGEFNASNALLVYASACLLGENPSQVITAVSLLNPAEGRMAFVRNKEGVTGIVDYAHTPDALENVLTTLRNLRRAGERIITVVGCGGDRDRTKRPLMAGIAATLSDQIVLTSDNPRSEDPVEIIREMENGLGDEQRKHALSIPERAVAIKTACRLAKPGDFILVAGKGHEKYQEIKGVKHPFDDLVELKQNLETN